MCLTYSHIIPSGQAFLESHFAISLSRRVSAGAAISKSHWMQAIWNCPRYFFEDRLEAAERAWLENVFWLDEVFACSTAIRIDKVVAYVLHVVASIFIMLSKWLSIDAFVTFSHSRLTLLLLRLCRLHEALSVHNRLKMNPDDQKCPSGQ